MAGVSTLRARPRRRSAVARFLRWWGGELAALVPAALRPRRRPPGGMLWLVFDGSRLVVSRLAGRALAEVGRVDLGVGETMDHKIALGALLGKSGARSLGICLDPARVLRRTVSLPLAAAGNLPQVLSFELPRLTPFAPDQAYFDHVVLGEDRAHNALQVRIGVVPRPVVDEPLARLAEWDLAAEFAAVRDELESGGDCLDLLPPALRPKPRRRGRFIALAMALTTLALFALLLALPIWKKREAVIALQPALAAARQQAEAVERLRQEQTRLLTEYNFPTEQKLAQPARIAVLEELARILPDNTWLQQIDIRGAEVSMQGYTSASARLIGLFEKSALFENAHYKSPLTKIQGSEERFQLDATIRTQDIAQALARQRAVREDAGRRPKPGGRRS
jgi:general secretion pathway protein L